MTSGGTEDAFLQAHGWGGASRRPLAGDASARSYVRLRRGSDGAVLMRVPPESGLTVAPFLAVAAWLRGLGLSAPAVFAVDSAAGLALLEDLGDDLFARICVDRAREPELYGAAIDLIADLQTKPLPPAADDYAVPPYDEAVLMREMRLAMEWYLPAARGEQTPPDLAAEFDALVGPIVATALDGPQVPVYRDFHAENLVWLPERLGHARVGLLDFQDLLVGHPAYDVVSLLEDARRDLGEDVRDTMMDRYLSRSGRDPETFDAAAHALSAQRNLKILGLFVRLARRDGKSGYLRMLPRVWSHLTRDLVHPTLAPLAAWVERRLPPPEALRVPETSAP